MKISIEKDECIKGRLRETHECPKCKSISELRHVLMGIASFWCDKCDREWNKDLNILRVSGKNRGKL